MSPPDEPLPTTLGSYRLFEELGRDALGVTYLACPAGSRAFPRWAVVRRMHPGVARDPVMIHSFVAATQAAVRMVHRNIATTFDFGGKMTVPWSAREHLAGATVVDLIVSLTAQRTKVPWAVASYLVAEAAEGVAALRARLPAYGPPMGFLTGAVAPSVFVSREGEVKIVDGCLPLVDGAPLIDSEALPYRPREPASDGANAARADAFGLGVILWELVAGRRLFAGQSDDETSRLLHARVVPSLRAAAKAPPVLDEIIARSVARVAPDGRPLASAAEVAGQLRASLVANGKRTSGGDVARLLREVLGASLDDDDARIARAWQIERALQAAGDVPSDVTSETELTVPIGDTVRDSTGETTVSSRLSGRRGVGFDEVPTVPKNSWSSDTPSWRTPPPSRLPPPSSRLTPPGSRVPAPRIEFVPVETMKSARPAPAVTQEPPSREAAVILKRTPPAFLLPPIERGAAFPPPPPFPPPAPMHPPLAPRAPPGRARSSILVAGGAGFAVAILGIVVFGVYQPSAPEGPATLVMTAEPPQRAPAAVRPTGRPPTPGAGSWNVLPMGPIPTASPDELPRAPVPTASPSPPARTWTPPAATGHTGLLTVFCTPACDEVYDGSRPLGPSPVFKVPARAGMHRLKLRVDALSLEKTVTVKVAENDTTVVRESLGD